MNRWNQEKSMTQNEFRDAMNKSKRDGGLLYVTNGVISSIALGYDSGTDEVVLFMGQRLSMAECQVDDPPMWQRALADAV